MNLTGKKILVGVTGGIAAYKAAYFVRALKKQGAQVRVMMTEAATKFITPLTFESLSENKVAVKMFSDEYESAFAHIDWARWPDAIVICPATANTIGKVVHGIADNLLVTTILATTAPVIFCPAMNVEMYHNHFYQQNEAALVTAGYHVVAPGEGELACGEVGAGRMAEPEEILPVVDFVLSKSNKLAGKKVLVTAGPTREPLDPVRFISNRSSGKMGYAVASQAAHRGADVTLVAGPTILPDPYRVSVRKIQTAQEMAEQVARLLPESDVLVMAAAVADFRAAHNSPQKLKKTVLNHTLELAATVDILQQASTAKGHKIFVGFALETENELANTREKMQRKNCDLWVINNPLEDGAGFDVDTNKVTLLSRDGQATALPLLQKEQVAQEILDRVEGLLNFHG